MSKFSPATGKEARSTSCYGLNHSDHGRIGYCDRCGEQVVQTAKGHLAPLQISPTGMGTRFSCWSFHECRPLMAEFKSVQDAQAILDGEVVKGATVEVFKGRKVPVGTVGIVRFLDPDGAFGPRVGIAVEGVEKLTYLAAANVRPVVSDEQREAATELVETYNAKHAAWTERIEAADAILAETAAERTAFFASIPADIKDRPEAERKALGDEFDAKHSAIMDRELAALAEKEAVKAERGW